LHKLCRNMIHFPLFLVRVPLLPYILMLLQGGRYAGKFRKFADLNFLLCFVFADLPQMWQITVLRFFCGTNYFCGLKTSANPQMQ
jgi:hypothetical protein